MLDNFEHKAINLTAHWAEQAFCESTCQTRENDHRFQLILEGVPGDTQLSPYHDHLLGEIYGRDFGVHAPSELHFLFAKPIVRLLSVINLESVPHGAENTVGNFKVLTDNELRFSTTIAHDMPPQAIDIDLGCTSCLSLIVENGGLARAEWCHPRVVFEDGSTLWLDTLASITTLGGGFPCSFVYDGVYYDDNLLSSWKRTLKVDLSHGRRICRTLILTDPKTLLEVEARVTVYTQSAGVEWTLYFTNRGNCKTPILERINVLDTLYQMRLGAQVTLRRLRGSLADGRDWEPFDETIPYRHCVSFEAIGGCSSNTCPFFMLDWEDGGCITAIGWSGQWAAGVERLGSSLKLHAGMQYQHFYLNPGETVRSPRIFQLYWDQGDCVDAWNLFRRAMLKEILPKHEGKNIHPPLAQTSTAFFETNAATQEDVLKHLHSLDGLGFETFWLDTYWTQGGFPMGMGNYGFPIERSEPKDLYPDGLRAIGDAVHQAGLDFLMCFEPERVAPGTLIDQQHPQWVMKSLESSQSENSWGRLLNLGNSEAFRYIADYLHAVIDAYQLNWIRIDFNMEPLEYWRAQDVIDPDRTGISEIRYIEGLYALWDELLTEHPLLKIDNCASGGRRIDLETCSRSIPLWRTDGTISLLLSDDLMTAAIINQSMTAGLNRYLPYHVSGQMGLTPYLLRSGFNGGYIACDNFQHEGDLQQEGTSKAILKEAFEEFKRLRRYWEGDFYALLPPTSHADGWCAWQLHLPGSGEGMVMAFRRHLSPYCALNVPLRWIDEDTQYEVWISLGFNREASIKLSGYELRDIKIKIEMLPGSVVIEYRPM